MGTAPHTCRRLYFSRSHTKRVFTVGFTLARTNGAFADGIAGSSGLLIHVDNRRGRGCRVGLRPFSFREVVNALLHPGRVCQRSNALSCQAVNSKCLRRVDVIYRSRCRVTLTRNSTDRRALRNVERGVVTVRSTVHGLPTPNRSDASLVICRPTRGNCGS